MSSRKLKGALAVLFASVLGTAAAAATPEGLRFEQAFPETQASLHYRAEYRARGASHRLEAWLDRGTRLKRVTDGRSETHALRANASEPEYRMTVLDLDRRIATRIDRTNLLRLGQFTDWYELAHALRHPRGAYQLTHATAPAGVPRPIARCEWYRLTQQGGSNAICWSREAALPLLIVDPQGQVSWRVTLLERRPVADAVFVVPDRDFVHNDANEDIERD